MLVWACILSVLLPAIIFAAAIAVSKRTIDASLLGASDCFPVDFDAD